MVKKCPKKRPPKEVMCKLIDDHEWKKKGKFTKVCKNCGKETVDEDALNQLIALLEARIAGLENQLAQNTKKGTEDWTTTYPQQPWTTTTEGTETTYVGGGGSGSSGVTFGTNIGSSTSYTMTPKEVGEVLKEYKSELASLKDPL